MRNVLLRLLRPLLTSLAALPVALAFGAAFMPASPLCWYAAPAAHLLLSWLCLWVKGKHRWTCGIICTVIQTAILLALLPWQSAWQLLLLPIGFGGLLPAMLPVYAKPVSAELSPVIPITGMVGYILLQFSINQDAVRRALIQTPLFVCFLAFGLLVMLMLNRLSLLGAMVDGVHRPPAALRRKHLLLTLSMFGLAVLVGMTPMLAEGLNRLWLLLLSCVAWLMSLLPQMQTYIPSEQGGDGMDPAALFGEAAEPALWAVITEKLLIVLGLILAVIGIVLLLRAAVRAVIHLARIISSRFMQLAAASGEEYVDETIDTRPENDASASMLRRILTGVRRTEHAPDDPRSRIRYTYALLRRRHRTDWQPSQTARDTLSASAAQLYEEARYSRHDVSAEDAARFEAEVRQR